MNTPREDAAIIVDMLLTAYNRTQIMTTNQIKAIHEKLDKTALTEEDKYNAKKFLRTLEHW